MCKTVSCRARCLSHPPLGRLPPNWRQFFRLSRVSKFTGSRDRAALEDSCTGVRFVIVVSRALADALLRFEGVCSITRHVAASLLVCELSLGARPMLLQVCQQNVENALLTIHMLYP